MLEELRIRGLGVIDEAVLPLGPGLTVVSGETGAGKTMVVTGLVLLFGGRADTARVRSGAERASVDGRLQVAADSAAAQRVLDAGGDLDDGTGLVLRRTVSAAGRSRAHVGGAPTPVAVLGELADSLLTVHGQADQLRLTRPGEQRAVLDRYAGLDLSEYRAAYQDWRDADAALTERTQRSGELRREADLLTYGLNEIEAADPQPGEDAELAALAGRLAHADALRLAARTAHDALLGDTDAPATEPTDVTAALGAAQRLLTVQAGADPALDALAVRITDLAALAADLGAEFGSYADGLDADPDRLEQVEARRAVLTGLVRKYADGPEPDVAGVLAWAERASARLEQIDVSDEAIAGLVRARDTAARRAVALAGELSAARRSAARKLAEAVTGELSGLAMPTARLEIAVDPRPAGSGQVAETDGGALVLGADGADDVEFRLQPHPDAPPLPLARGASGGELSRVMLALEVCLADTEPVPTIVFDEIDAGIGGRAATEVGRRLARLGRDRQVLVVTHLAQVAAYADRHIVVDRRTELDDQASAITRSDVREVTGDERTAELARMLSGTESGTARDHAAELLESAMNRR